MKRINLAHKNGQWKGDNVGYGSLHAWIKARITKPDYCKDCGIKTDKLDLANISQDYKRDIKDWEYICRRCHMKKDGRLKKLRIIHPLAIKNITKCSICGCGKKKGEECRGCVTMMSRKGRLCTVTQCTRPHRRNGFCSLHSGRYKNGTDMNKPLRVIKTRRH